MACPWDFPGKNTRLGYHFLLQIFPTQGLNPGLPHCRQTLYRLSHQGSYLPGANYRGGNEDNGNLLKRSHAHTATLSAPNPAVGHCRPTPPPETPRHSIYVRGKPFNITVIQVYAPTSNAEETEVERFYEDLQDLLELTPKKDVLFILGDWNTKVGSQETPGVTGKFGLGVQNEAGQRLTDFCQENALVIANTLSQ